MAASTFAALFLAHVIADYLLQTDWMVTNKYRASAIGLHVLTVLVAMPLVTLSLSPWFLVLAAMHLAIDLTKTHLMPGGLWPYVADQILHLASIGVIVWLAPDLWSISPLAGTEWVAPAYLILAMVIFAARGGQFAVATHLGQAPAIKTHGIHAQGVGAGWAERSALPGAVALGVPWMVLPVLLLKAGEVLWSTRGLSAPARSNQFQAAILSMGWALACAVALWSVLPTVG
jgi:hypothetical protein